MATLAEVKKNYSAAVDELEVLAADGGEAYDAKLVEVEKLKGTIERLTDVEKRKAAAAVPVVTTTGQETRAAPTVPAAPAGERVKGLNVARMVMALAANKCNARDAADYAEKTWGSQGDPVTKNLLASVGTAGGFLIPDDFREELIELLRPASVVFASNPRLVSMPRGNMGIPGLASGASASYVGETQPIPVSSQTYRGINLVAKKLAAIVPISNDMLRYPNMSTERFVRDDIIAAIATVTDQTLVRSLGSQFSPRGLRGWVQDVAATNVHTANTTVNVVNVTSDLAKLELSIENANVPTVNPGWIMSPRSKSFLGNLRDANSNFVFPEVMSQNFLRGKPIRTTTSVPDNIGGTSVGSEIYLTEFSQFIVGEAIGLEVASYDGAAYFDGTNTVSGVSQDQTIMRALTAHDSGMRQARAVAFLDDVRWIP